MEPRLRVSAPAPRVCLRREGDGQADHPQADHREPGRDAAQPARAQRAPASLEARMTGPRAVYPPVRPRRLPTWLRAVGWLALLLSALFVVTWRQTRGLELDAALRDLATQHELAEAERLEHQRNIQRLR